MFSNLNWYNVVILVLLALFIFGDRLPKVISDGLRLLRRLRGMAQNATSDLSRELGTEITLADLHPKSFVRKHLLSEADQEALLKPLKGVSDELLQEGRRLESDLRGVGRGLEDAAGAAGVDGRRPDGRSAGSGRSAAPGPAASGLAAAGPVPPGPPPDPTAAAPPSRPRYDDIT